jgi:hypothetical protein
MSSIIDNQAVEQKIIEIRGHKAIIDSHVAELYGVETKRINEAVKNNSDKFPDGYLLALDKTEWELLKSKFSTSIKGGKVKLPTAFTEKGLYMLATILKSPKATETTLAIIDTFTKVREVNRIINQLPAIKENSPERQNLMHHVGDIISDLVVPEGLETEGTEATIELNFAVVKFKYTVKKKPKQ